MAPKEEQGREAHRPRRLCRSGARGGARCSHEQKKTALEARVVARR